MIQNPLIGKKITAVYLAEDQHALKFDIENDEPMIVLVDAECCSHTWIEYIENPENLLGIVTKVEDLDMPQEFYDLEAYECISFYGCKIYTEKGSCLLDYRNESNGYYGGSLCWPGDYYYGGVGKQQNSKFEWKKIA